MQKEDLIHLKKWFAAHVGRYYTGDRSHNAAIKLKEKHTMRVCRDILMLGGELRLSEQDMVLAEVIALFHDIGRFEQYAVYGVFRDMDSEDHAALGLRQMEAHNVLSMCSQEEKQIITKAIAYHNAATLPGKENGKTLFFSRLLRDADKLDIWRLFTDYYQEFKIRPDKTLQLGLPDDPQYSIKVIQALQERRIIRLEHLKTLNDLKLLQIGWVYDLNFVPSFKALQRRGYIELIAKTLPQSKEILEAVEQAREHVLSRVNNSY